MFHTYGKSTPVDWTLGALWNKQNSIKVWKKETRLPLSFASDNTQIVVKLHKTYNPPYDAVDYARDKKLEQLFNLPSIIMHQRETRWKKVAAAAAVGFYKAPGRTPRQNPQRCFLLVEYKSRPSCKKKVRTTAGEHGFHNTWSRRWKRTTAEIVHRYNDLITARLLPARGGDFSLLW